MTENKKGEEKNTCKLNISFAVLRVVCPSGVAVAEPWLFCLFFITFTVLTPRFWSRFCAGFKLFSFFFNALLKLNVLTCICLHMSLRTPRAFNCPPGDK